MHKTHIFDQRISPKFFDLPTYLPYFFSDPYRKQTFFSRPYRYVLAALSFNELKLLRLDSSGMYGLTLKIPRYSQLEVVGVRQFKHGLVLSLGVPDTVQGMIDRLINNAVHSGYCIHCLMKE